MASMMHCLILVLALSTMLEVTHAVEHVVGGDVQKWSFLQFNANQNSYNTWAANVTFKTGDSLLFEYDNVTHSVVQVVEADYTTCNLKTPIERWGTGHDSLFISKAGTYFYICGTPRHCEQGMKVTITATGVEVAAPPPPPPVASAVAPAPATNANHAGRVVMVSGALSLLVAISHSAVLLW